MGVNFFADNHYEISKDNLELTDDEFYRFAVNSSVRIERDADGTILIMPPADTDYGMLNSRLDRKLGNWSDLAHNGYVFDSSTGFTLPDSSVRSPDVAWISKVRYDALSPQERKGFARICPDFVAELRSPSDSLPELHRKMEQYMRNGCRLGWLIDPAGKQAWVYRPGSAPEHINSFRHRLSGESVLEGFELDLALLELPG